VKQLYYISFCTTVLLLLIALFLPPESRATLAYADFFAFDTIPVSHPDTINTINPDTLAVTPKSIDSINALVRDIPTDSVPVFRQRRRGIDQKDENEKDELKRLETYVFTDSALKAQRIFVWSANHYFNNISLTKIDTLINENKTELPFYKNDVGVTYLGTTGSATVLHNYFKRTSTEFLPFFDPYAEYLNTPEKVVFYNTKTPYSDLGYATSGSKRVAEDNLKVLFTANILPEWNFGILYNRFGTKGTYQNQGTKDKSFTAFTSYTGKRYVAHTGYIYNAITNNENGGIIDDYYFVDTVLDAGAIDINLKQASNKLRSNIYFLTHSYGIPVEILNKRRDSTAIQDGGTMVYFGHSFEYTRYNRVYTDALDTENYYYDKYYLSRNSSYDSIAASQLNNRLFIRLQPWSSNFWVSNIDAGIGYRFENYYYFNPAQYLQGKGNDKYSTAYIYGGASGVFKRYFKWDAFLKYHFTGYRQNDLLFDITAKASIYPLAQGVHLQGRFTFDNKQPAYFTEHYYANHVKWENDFDKTQETKIQLSLSIPDWSLEAGFNSALVNKPIYYGLDALPKQSADVINITSIHLQKNLKLWLFHFEHRLLLQLTSNKDVIPLPLLSGNVTYYLQSEWVRNILNTQIGFDVYYNTKFYDYAYNPAVGMFHIQNEKKLGNYPWIDLFANFKWKRANIYIKMTNVAQGIIGNRDYFSALHYPRTNRMLRIGIRWHFFT
jgi:hypothetical protein